MTGRDRPFAAATRLLLRWPYLSSAILALVCGFLAIWAHFPTVESSAALAGALFGAAAAFIGAWVSEQNRAVREGASRARDMEVARAYFAPELARIVARQSEILSRAVVNFIMASAKKPMPKVEPWESLRPQRPVLYPSARQFRDLSAEDATALISFYDSTHAIAELLDTWVATKMEQDVNTWRFLMGTIRASLDLGASAVMRICPEHPLSPSMPPATLIASVKQAVAGVDQAVAAHMARQGAS